jgi:hypothetical protein
MKRKIAFEACHGSEVGLKYRFCVQIFAKVIAAFLRKLLAKIFENGEKNLRKIVEFSLGLLQKRQSAKICASQEQHLKNVRFCKNLKGLRETFREN